MKISPILLFILITILSFCYFTFGQQSDLPTWQEDDVSTIQDNFPLVQQHSFSPPLGIARIPNFIIDGDTVVTDDYIQLTPNSRRRSGRIANEPMVGVTAWQAQVKFRVSGARRGGDGFALWYSDEHVHEGDVLGGANQWKGVGVFFESGQRSNKGSISVQLNDGTKKFDTSLASGKCAANIRTTAAKTPFQSFVLRYTTDRRLIGLLNPDPLQSPSDYVVCFDLPETFLPTGYHFALSAGTGPRFADKHEIESFVVFNLNPGGEDDSVYDALHQRTRDQQKPTTADHKHVPDPTDLGEAIKQATHHDIDPQEEGQKDAENAPHIHTKEEELAEKQQDEAENEPHIHTKEEELLEKQNDRLDQVKQNDGIASKMVGEKMADIDAMKIFKFKKRFSKIRERLKSVEYHDDAEHDDDGIIMPDSAADEPMVDDLPAPDNIEELYEILADEVYMIKKMQHDTLQMFKQLESVISHANKHMDDQHRVFAESFDKLLREVATRHTVEDALKEQLLHFEEQRTDFDAINNELRKFNKEFVTDINAVRSEFDQVSKYVKQKVGATQEIMAQQVKDLVQEFGSLKAEQSSLTTMITSIKQMLSNNNNQQTHYQIPVQQQQNSDSGQWVIWLVVGVVVVFAIAAIVGCIISIANRKQTRRRDPPLFS